MLTIIVPVYNEERAIGPFHHHLIDAMKTGSVACEILYVNDGSTDATAAVLDGLGANVLHFDRNRGYGAALKAGIARCVSEFVAIIDCDGTYDPRDIPKLFNALENNDMVIGCRPRSWGLRTIPNGY